MNYFRTVRSFFRQSFVNPFLATARHTGWQCRKFVNGFPHDLHLDGTIVRIPDRAVANGCGALLNALGYYDPNNMGFLREIFRRDCFGAFFDIGANIGVYSLIVASESRTARVVAIEPHKTTCRWLKENVRRNDLQDRVSCLEVALGDHSGFVQFQDRAGHPENRVLDADATAGPSVEVRLQTGDSLCDSLGVIPEVVKIDVEGHQDRVIEGFAHTLSEIGLVLVESRDVEETASHLRRYGDFLGPRKIDLRNHRFVEDDIHFEDWLFVNSKQLGRFNDWL